MARDLQIYGFQATLIAIPAGASNAFLVLPMPGEIASQIKYFSGGSLEILNASDNRLNPGATGLPGGASAIFWYGNGVTAAPGVTATAAGIGYMLATTETVSYDGAARYWLVATGSTCTAYLLKGITTPW